MGTGNLLSHYIPNKATDKAETIFQSTQLSIILNWNEMKNLFPVLQLCKNKITPSPGNSLPYGRAGAEGTVRVG